jgi:hypothetical protein
VGLPILVMLFCCLLSCRNNPRAKDPFFSFWDLAEPRDRGGLAAATSLTEMIHQRAYAEYARVVAECYREGGDFITVLADSHGVMGSISLVQASNHWQGVTLQMQQFRGPAPTISSTVVPQGRVNDVFRELDGADWRNWPRLQQAGWRGTCIPYMFILIGHDNAVRFSAVSGEPPASYKRVFNLMLGCVGNEAYFGSLPVPQTE